MDTLSEPAPPFDTPVLADASTVLAKTAEGKKEESSLQERIRKKGPPLSYFNREVRQRFLTAPPPPSGDATTSLSAQAAEATTAAASSDDRQKAVDKRWYAGYELNSGLTNERKKTYGMKAELSRFRPYVEEQDVSLIQILLAHSHDSHKFQSLEAGWRRDGDRFLDEKLGNVELFIFFTTNEYGPDGVGVSGFVTENNHRGYKYLKSDKRNVWRAGTFMPATHIGGPQETLALQWELFKGKPKWEDGWYLSINGVWNGYFPLRYFELGSPAKNQNSLADHANTCDFYGEVLDNDFDRANPPPPGSPPAVRTTTDMGSGRWPAAGFRKAAFIRNIARKVTPPGGRLPFWEPADDTTFQNYNAIARPAVDPTMYDIKFRPRSGTEGVSIAYLGGPGARLAGDQWEEWEDISGTDRKLRGPEFDAVGSVCVTQPRANVSYVFLVGADGYVWCCQQNADNDWSGFNDRTEWTRLFFGKDSTPKLHIRAPLAVVSRTPTRVDVFAIGQDGKVWWCPGMTDLGFLFLGWKDISNDTRVPPTAPMTAISRRPEQLDVFINAGGSRIISNWWRVDMDNEDWHEWETRLRRDPARTTFSEKARPLVLARQHETLDVFMPAENGHVYHSSWIDPDGPWEPFYDIGTSGRQTPTFFHNARLGGVVDGPDRMDLFCIADDRQLYWCTYTTADGWSGIGGDANNPKFWTPIGFGSQKATNGVKIFSSLSDVVAVRRAGMRDMDVLVTGYFRGSPTVPEETHVYRANFNGITNVWRTVANTNTGWDTQVGGGDNRWVIHDEGFNIGVASRWPKGLGPGITVVSIMRNRRVVATEFGRR